VEAFEPQAAMHLLGVNELFEGSPDMGAGVRSRHEDCLGLGGCLWGPGEAAIRQCLRHAHRREPLHAGDRGVLQVREKTLAHRKVFPEGLLDDMEAAHADTRRFLR
jgi:hypothetical protein